MGKFAVQVVAGVHGCKFDCGGHGNTPVRSLLPTESMAPCYECLTAEVAPKTNVVGFRSRRRYKCNADGTVVEEPMPEATPALPCVVVMGAP